MIVFDIETDGLGLDEITKIHCICTHNTETMEFYVFSEDIESGVEYLYNRFSGDEEKTIIGHNIIGYDIPVIQKFYPWFKPKKVIDTLVLARLLEPDKKGGWSLENYGKQFNKEKVGNEEWGTLSENIIERCKKDVEITTRLFEYFNGMSNPPSSGQWNGSEIEHEFAKIHQMQRKRGWHFAKDRAIAVGKELKQKLNETDNSLKTFLKPNCKKVTTISKPFKKNGSYSMQCDRYNIKPLGPCSIIEFNDINLASADQRKKLLLSLGWQPTEWNYNDDGAKTSPKLTEDSYDSLPGELGQLLAIRAKILARLKLLLGSEGKGTGLIANVRADGRISADGIPCATPTGRMIHRVVVNIPKCSKFYGQQIRELFTCDDDRILMGCDLSSIQWRCFAHYNKDPEVIETVSHGDIHEYINKIARLDNREIAKQLGFGILFGGGTPLVAQITGRKIKEAEKIKSRIINELPGFRNLIERVRIACKKGHLIGLDGRKLYFRKVYSALNLLIQSAEAIIVKKAAIIINNDIYKNNYDAFQVGLSHDEFIFDCEKKVGKVLTSIAIDAIKLAGVELGLRCPLDAKAKTGQNWAEIH